MWTCVYACIFTVCAPYVHVYTWKCACMLSLACDTAQMPFCMFLYLQIDIVHVCNSIIYIESILTQIDHQLCLHMTHANCPLSMKNAWKYSALCPCMNALLTVSSLFAFVQPPPRFHHVFMVTCLSVIAESRPGLSPSCPWVFELGCSGLAGANWRAEQTAWGGSV